MFWGQESRCTERALEQQSAIQGKLPMEYPPKPSIRNPTKFKRASPTAEALEPKIPNPRYMTNSRAAWENGQTSIGPGFVDGCQLLRGAVGLGRRSGLRLGLRV